MATFNLERNKIEEKNISSYKNQFERFYDTYSSKVYGFLISQTHSETASKELLVKVFLKVWNEITTFNQYWADCDYQSSKFFRLL